MRPLLPVTRNGPIPIDILIREADRWEEGDVSRRAPMDIQRKVIAATLRSMRLGETFLGSVFSIEASTRIGCFSKSTTVMKVQRRLKCLYW